MRTEDLGIFAEQPREERRGFIKIAYLCGHETSFAIPSFLADMAIEGAKLILCPICRRAAELDDKDWN